MEVTNKLVKGGEFIIKETAAQDVFTPADFSEEQNMMHQTALDFVEKEVQPLLERLDNHEEGLMRNLMEKAGELGLFGVSIPEQYGGLDMDFTTSLRVTEGVGGGHSFPVAFAAHTGIAMLPILYFGNEEQKAKYLPGLTSGELMGAYCLTEPGSGSDALGAKTKAILTEDGEHYVLNGQKMWITNGGFADVFIVFAQVDGDKFTGFIVEKNTPGLSLGNEEHKMGIKGSSTRQVFLSDVKVPKSAVLGEIGKGHLIAFNILNIGRIKLAAACLGATKMAATLSVKYANERVQFKLPISKFGAIKYKLAQQAVRIYAVESAIYRAGMDIARMEQELLAKGQSHNEALLGAAREFAVECAILKVEGSEVLDYVVDEGVQVYGGYGFSADYPMDRAYRDSRINRIFEGTNEINRMLAVDMILKKAMKGELDLMGPAQAVQQELMAIPDFNVEEETGLFAAEKKTIAKLKKAILMVAGTAVQKYMNSLAKEQEVLMNIADMAIKVYTAESVLLRVEKEAGVKGEEALAAQIDIARVYLSDTVDQVQKFGKDAIASMTEGDEQRLLAMGLKRFTKADLYNAKDARRRIADVLIAANEYAF
ncbi:alkylation response protein AidB-like acyl-CoA dehydrogenase [Hymenobacter luteus]|uniref:Alkylation response protein AidB-like acyl-CoA dehydrogenase n=2 Tax=Hymenobacter TaxID=89966 RepID=A0A7W9T2H1_9BACT|nr:MULTISPECIES: acyl-CoA dehydrogenase family protein [Hymenobacter]MBB4602481.1 alkylation response protein AidB-like acyl-CoA dehydrogenase [Hymenobacter latericoloratus]MBB6060372.1 alkylation response protein AidB-like acyl-CoA dehydrogenase [Hymenobacter luteus]